jgi:hypothetical protein
MKMDFYQTFINGSFNDGVLKGTFDQLRRNRYNIYAHATKILLKIYLKVLKTSFSLSIFFISSTINGRADSTTYMSVILSSKSFALLKLQFFEHLPI